jgi:hypothetical protein
MGYLEDHPTNFIWLPYVEARITRIQKRWPWKTYINTYYDHPPDPRTPRRWPVGYYDKKSFDVWGGGGVSARTYTGFRGKTLPKELGDKIFHNIMNAPGPSIDWIIWQGRMWWNPASGGNGWGPSPDGPAESDPGHYKHIHVTLR